MDLLFKRLRSLAKKAAQTEVGTNDDVLAIAVCTSVARGDVWPGSDIDLLVISKNLEDKMFRSEGLVDVYIDWHYFGKDMIDRTIHEYPESFRERRLPNLLSECTILYDPDRYLKKAHQFSKKHRFTAEVTSLRTRDSYINSKSELKKCDECMKKEEFLPAILHARQASFWCAATLIELDKKLFVKRRFLQMLRQTTEELGLPDCYPLYLRARDLANITKAKASDILSSFKSLVAGLVPFLQREETIAIDPNTRNRIREFQPRLATFYSSYTRGLEEYYKEEQFLELASLAELETYFRLGGIVAKLNQLNINYAAYSEKSPKDFLLHYKGAMRLENINESSAILARNEARQLLEKTGSLVDKPLQRKDSKESA